MTQQEQILEDEKYFPVLNHGFVGLVDVMGDDSSIVQAARVSYGAGTKKVNEDRGLIRYLIRHLHTTPIEMVEFKFHCKMPIFVARQWIRHRTANVNEYSGRYSVMVDEFYVPELENILPQSTTNNQGRGGKMNLADKMAVRDAIIKSNLECYIKYKNLLGENLAKSDMVFSDDFEGISREMARGVLSVNNYTEWYWKIDLHNLFQFLGLRMDEHAQWEIRQFANAMYDFVKSSVPLAAEAFEDYRLNSVRLSGMEVDLLKEMISHFRMRKFWTEKLAGETGMSAREITEFSEKFIRLDKEEK